MMSTFCYIENDEKTKHYVKITIDTLLNKKPMIVVDNFIQASEIEEHCNNSDDWDKNKLMCDWISSYAKSFRIYLNTIKVLALFIICSHKNIDDITPEEFEELRQQINGHGELLDAIY